MDKIVHAILINAAAKEIKVVRLGEDQLKSAYEHIGCEMIEPAVRLPNGDVLYVDEEALVKQEKPESKFSFAGQGWFIGNGLIVNEFGDYWTAPRSPVISLFESIVFEGA